MNWATQMLRLIRASNNLKPVLAAWSREMKQMITQKQLEEGSKIVEHELVEDFDLVLWENSRIKIKGFLHYYASINTGNYDPFDKTVQEQKIPSQKFRGKSNVG